MNVFSYSIFKVERVTDDGSIKKFWEVNTYLLSDTYSRGVLFKTKKEAREFVREDFFSIKNNMKIEKEN